MMARQVTADRAEAVFKATEGRAVCVSTVGAILLSECSFSTCFCARSVCSGADSVCSGTWEGRISVVLSGALCSTGGGFVGFDWGKDSTHSVSDCAFAVAGSMGQY